MAIAASGFQFNGGEIMFKRQKPESAPLRKPDSLSSSTLSSLAAGETMARSSGVPAQGPGSSALPRPSGVAFPAKVSLHDADPIPALPSILPPIRGVARDAELAASRRETSQRRTLVVGRGISVQGTIQDAERLVVEGTVEASMVHAAELSVSAGGMFKGGAEVEDAEVAGTIDGSLTVRGRLTVRATGKVLGTAHCHKLQVEDGGQVNGRVEMLAEAVRSEREPAVMEAAD
ncbi:MAG TPA: polymer-forming cytoskeletal protein [Acetobacteraceae bacterium]|nr:polymer-forming cytoskeletal protein [Acetobacteraceae bacterium]